MVIKPKLFLEPNAEADLKTSLAIYQRDLGLDQFAAKVMNCLNGVQATACDIHSFKSGTFGMIFRIVVHGGNTRRTYFLKFYRNRILTAEYPPERMKNLCLREYLTLKAARQKLLETEDQIGVITPVNIMPELACFITVACDGEDLQKRLCSKIKRYFLNPFNRLDKHSIISFLDWHVERVAKLLATIHELDLDYKLFNEQEPFHVLDFEYKREKFLETLQRFDASLYQKARHLVGMLTEKANAVFPSLQSTGLATPDTNLTNFIVETDKIYMMDFFLIQHGPCYQPIGKFIACLELVLYGFVSQKIITHLREKFITTYNTRARHHTLDQNALEFFINWNYMTFLPRYGAAWKRFYQKKVFQKKLTLILKNWQDSMEQNR